VRQFVSAQYNRCAIPSSPWLMARTLLIVIGLLGSTGCLEDGKIPSSSTSECSDAFEKVIIPIQINGGHHLSFNIDDFDFLLDPNVQITDIRLEGIFYDHKEKELDDFSFSVNGIKAIRRDGGRHFESRKHKEDKEDESHFSNRVHKYYLNGGEPFHRFLIKLKKNKGILKLSLHGKHNKVRSAQLVVTGIKYIKCENPPPPPPPPPPAVAPKTVIDSVAPTGSVTNSTSMSIAFSSDQMNVSFVCSLDGSSAPCSSPVNYSGLTNGDHVFTVSATNAGGLSDVTPPTYSWNIDSVAPTVTIDNLADLKSLTNQTSHQFLFSSSEAGTFTCSLDGATASPCSSPLAFTNLAEGSHQVSINIVDLVGNPGESPASFQWVIDVTAPVTSIVSASPSAPINNSATIEFQFAANESATLQCSIDNNAFNTCVSPLSINNLVEGAHWFEVRAADVAGNIGLPASYSWSVDLSAPLITLGNILPLEGLTNSKDVSVDFSISEVSDVTCSFDGVPLSPCISPFTTSVLTDGNHNLVISAIDGAGNLSTSAQLNWTMDFTLPSISFGAILPSASSNINSNSLTVEVIPSEIVNFSSTLNGEDLAQSVSPIVLSNLPQGFYILEVTAIDSAGNPANSISHSFTVDQTSPLLTVNSSVGVLTNSDNNTLTFSANESASFSCNVDASGYTACASPLALSGLADGEHNVEVKATDLAGNVSTVSTLTWVVDTLASTTSLTAHFSKRNVVTFTLSASEANSTFLCSLDGAVSSACTSPKTYTVSVGAHSFLARAVDAAGNIDPVGATYNFTVTPPITTTLVSASFGSLTNQNSMTFTFTSNHSNASFQCSLDNAAPSVCTSPKSYTGLADASHNFRVQAIDIYGGVDAVGASFSWVVDTTSPSIIPPITFTSTSSSVTINWTTNELATSSLLWGLGSSTNISVADDGVYKTSHSIRVLGLSPNTLYSFKPGGHDPAGNTYVGGPFSVRTNR